MGPVGAARTLFAVVAALLLGVWLWRRSRAQGELSPNSGAKLRVLLLLLLGVFALFWLVLAGVHLYYPYELEWHGGAWKDHCDRLLTGQPLYAPPSPDWIAFPYPPLYVTLCALAMKAARSPTFAVMRLVSIACTLGSAGLIFLWTRRLVGETPPATETPSFEEEEEAARARRAGRLWGFIAVGLFLAAYRFTGLCFDREQPDMLFLFLVLLGGYWLERSAAPVPPPRIPRSARFRIVPFRPLLRRRGNGDRLPDEEAEEEAPPKEEPAVPWIMPAALLTAGAAAVVLTLAFVTHIGALLFVVGGGLALVRRRTWPQAIFFWLVAGVCCAEIVWALDATTQGWFSYYGFRVFAAGVTSSPHWNAAWREALIYAPCAVVILLGLTVRFPDLQADQPPENQTGSVSAALPVAFAVMGALLGLCSRAFWADWEAVPVGYTLVGMAACILAGRWARAHPAVRVPLYALLLAQWAALAYLPTAAAPTWANAAAGRRINEIVTTLETQGEVLTPDHGGLTVPRHFHVSALQGVLRLEKRLPVSFAQALRTHRFVAVLTDTYPYPGTPLTDELLRSYAPAEGPEIGGPWVVTGRQIPSPLAHRVWVLRPRAPRLH